MWLNSAALTEVREKRDCCVVMLTDEKWFKIIICWCVFRYSDSTIQALEMLDSDEKIDLDLILALIRHIVLNEGVSVIFSLDFCTVFRKEICSVEDD